MTQTLGGQYHLLERIGRGGMAEVWKAISRGPAGFEKVVVIKRVLPHLARSEHFVEMLVREAKIAARLTHANIVQIFDLGVAGETYFIAMEHVDGLNLAQLMVKVGQRRADFPLPLRLHVVAELAKALDFAHRQRDEAGRPLGIVHRDVSPANVLLSREGEVKLADFGIATAEAADMLDRDKGRIRGKVSYMSPEQARAEGLDHRSDVFSLGVILYELSTGRRLFRAENTRETLRRVRKAEVPRLAELAPHLPPELGRLVERVLAADREDRVQGAGEIHSALTALIFSLGHKIEQAELGRLVNEMIPAPRGQDPNKLAVDLLIRALDDATGVVSQELTRHPAPVEDGRDREVVTAAEIPLARHPEQELRRVTVLLVRLTRAADRPVAERTVREGGGHVVAARPDEVAALFGFPKAVENAPERAVRTGLELRRRLTGDLVTDELAQPAAAVIRGTVQLDRSLAEAPPTGELVTECRAVLERAAPSELLVRTDLAPLLEPSFQIRGAAEGLWAVTGLRRRLERLALAAAGSGSLVGRDHELQRILRALSGVCDGAGTVLLLQGEPGAGKTRLVFEVRSLVTHRDIAFRLGRSSARDRRIPYELVVDLVRDVCGVDETDGPEEIHAKVRRLRQLGLSARETRIVGGLLGLEYPVDPARDLGTRPKVLWVAEALRKVLHALGRDRPMVVALEDQQWVDDSSADVLRLLVRAIASSRVLLLLTARPGAEPVLGDSAADLLVLQPLEPARVRELAAQRLGVELLDTRLAEWISARSGGNPGFVVELCRTLLRNGAVEVKRGRACAAQSLDEMDVPGSVRELVAATLDGLKKGERKVLRASAVIGSELEPDLVRQVSQVKATEVVKRLETLAGRGLLISEDPESDPSSRRYAFRHEILREAVVRGIGPDELRDLHGRIAEALERRAVDHAHEKVETLAEHLFASGAEDRAIDLLEAAGEHKSRQGEHAAAACRFARAANAAGDLETTGGRERGAVLGLKAAEALLEAGQKEAAKSWFAQARALAELGEAPLALARALAGEARLELLGGEPGPARALLGRALGAAEALGERDLAARIAVDLGRALMQLGEPGEAAECLTKAAAAAELLGDEPLVCSALVSLASARVMEERYAEAELMLDRVTERAIRSRVASERCEALMGLGELAVARDRLDDAFERFAAAREVALRHDLLVAEAQATLRAAEVQVLRGNPGQAHALAADVSHSAQALGLSAESAFARVLLGYLDATELGEADGARRLSSALKDLERAGRRPEAAMGHVLLAWAYGKHGSLPAARRSLAAALELAGKALAPAARRLATRSLAELEAPEPG